jgi:hypothetical protein
MSNEDVSLSFGSYLRAHGVRLPVHPLLLLHEKVDEAAEDDALSCRACIFPPSGEASTSTRLLVTFNLEY